MREQFENLGRTGSLPAVIRAYPRNTNTSNTTPMPTSTPQANSTISMLDRLADKSGQLYSLPAVAMKVIELTRNPQVDIAALKNCIENDPALTGKILRVVNSSLFGLSREVSDLNQALALLGTKPLKMLVLGFSLPPGLFSGVSGESIARYWRHTLTKAIAAREVCETFFKSSGDEAFIAGLLQDIGELMLMQELGAPYTLFLDKVHAGGNDLATLESETLGFEHEVLSAKLLTSWGLPDVIVKAISTTYPSRRGEHLDDDVRDLAQVVYLGELVARLLVDRRPEALRKLLVAGQHFRGITKEQLEPMVCELEEKVQQLADVLSLQLPKGTDYRDVLAEAHLQLASVADEAAEDMLRRQQEELLNTNVSSEVRLLAAAVAQVSSTPSSKPRVSNNPASGGRAAREVSTPDVISPRAASTASTSGTRPTFSLLEQLATAVAACRQSRCSISLLLLCLDEADHLADQLGKEGVDKLQKSLDGVCRSISQRPAICIAHGSAGLAMILPDCERREAVELSNQIIEKFHISSQIVTTGDESLVASVSIGAATVALPPKNFPVNDLFAAADRCLYGSHSSGGGVVKSIEIY